MRQDLNKVMCESGRNGGDDFHAYRKRMEDFTDLYEDLDDDMPHKGDSSRGRTGIRTSKIYWNGRKSFDEHLAPLRGIIRKNVGRQWNKVYSELCRVFDKRSVINQHILIHLFEYVETKDIVVKEGKLFYQEKYRYGKASYEDRLVPIRESRLDWYVDPRTGCLCENKHKFSYRAQRKRNNAERAKAELDQKQAFADGSSIFRDAKGIWFYCKEVTQTSERKTRLVQKYNKDTNETETVEEHYFEFPALRDYKGRMVRGSLVTVELKAMNSAELKYYGVENRYEEEKDGFSQAKLKKLARRGGKRIK